MGLSVGYMPTDEHFYYVLAKDSYAAIEAITALRNLHQHAVYLSLTSFIEYKDPKSLTFVFVPGWELCHNSGDLWLAASAKIKKGASVDPAPKKTRTSLADAISNMSNAEYMEIRPDALKLPFTDAFMNSLDQVKPLEKPGPEDPAYYHVFLGGSHNGQKSTPISAPDGRILLMKGGLPSTYLSYEVVVLGSRLTFWICNSIWADRQKRIRQYLLNNVTI